MSYNKNIDIGCVKYKKTYSEYKKTKQIESIFNLSNSTNYIPIFNYISNNIMSYKNTTLNNKYTIDRILDVNRNNDEFSNISIHNCIIRDNYFFKYYKKKKNRDNYKEKYDT